MFSFSDYVNKKTKNSDKNLSIIYGAGIVGRMTLEALNQKNIKVDFICDGSPEKQKIKVKDIEVISPESLDKLDKETDIFVTIQYFNSIIPILEKKGFKNLYKVTDLLSDTNLEKSYKSEWAVELGMSEIPYSNALRIVDFYNKMGMKNDYFKEGKLHVKAIDIQVTERCSLKCQDCSNLMQYYDRPQNSEEEIMFESIERFMACIDVLDEFRVIGGDPFMNKELYKVVNKLATYEKNKKIVVYTNAKIVPKNENLECLKNDKVSVYITNYGRDSIAHDALVDVLKNENINYSTFKCTTWIDCGRIMPNSNKSQEALEHQFENCCVSDLTSLLHGKIYRCPFSANASNLKAIPENASDEVNLLDKNLSISELRGQINTLLYEKKSITACSFCNGRDYSVPTIPSAIQTKKPLSYTKVLNKTSLVNRIPNN
jgi:organic radical activating enzyme